MRYGRPHSILDTAPGEIAPQYRLEPSPLALVSARVQYRPEERWQWAVLRKITYGVGDDGVLYRVDQQEPVHRAGVPHAPLPDWLGRAAGREGSMKTVPEARVTQSGTDVVIRGHAASARPVREMLAGVVIGKHAHKLRVSGERLTRVERGRVAFSEPQWFERVPLRYELAYGGVDAVALQLALKLARQRLGDLEFRRASAFLKDTLPAVAPLCYARNPVGTGYVADAVAEALHDVALPRIELECDPLNPERFGAGNPLQWLAKPVPAGMDFMDVPMFPRTAMMGLPPLGYPRKPAKG
ncbi:DUF2169 domain-containing protein [Diaphorobacter aerolatus]|uniref:DUF2169 domain-containing protein n=1 Tax=Diaphorobacter aerolatus TaxID=1288495 RepID=A0A7H0GLJ4_9BURK|nr:DUF2169 domain-containing protein [Diaphorobacter aerolatus]QNP49160.1 DUF2169 domain-containing protein [Diaphorobacter aerolatus]